MNVLQIRTGCALCTVALLSSWSLGVFSAGADPTEPESEMPLTAAGPGLAEPSPIVGSTFLDLRGIAVDSSGNTYVTGQWGNTSGGSDFATVKYDSAGRQLWQKRYNGPVVGSHNQPTGIAVDSAGTTYVTGGSEWDHQHDYVTIRYNRYGAKKWERLYNGPAQGYDWPTGIAVDSSGNAYVTGDSQIADNRWDFTTVKYDSSGKKLWTKRYAGPYKGSNRPSAIALDSSGNAYITGDSQTSASRFDFATIKYDRYGNQLWSRRYTREGSDYNWPSGIGVSPDGSTYVTGNTRGQSTGGDFTTIRYDKNGNRIWAKHYNSGHGDDTANGIGVDRSGNAYLTGSSGSGDFLTVKYDSSGRLLWTRTYNGTGQGYDYARAIAVDSAGYTYVTGQSYGDGSNTDFATIKYGPGGKAYWVTRFNGQGNGQDSPAAIAIDSSGNAYVSGRSQLGPGEVFGFATVKYDSSGKQTWVSYYSGQ